jgi:hypothetical protein
MKPRIIALAFAAFAFALPVFADTPSSLYSGQQTHSIKALSDEDIAGRSKVRAWVWRGPENSMATPARSMS